MTFWETKVGARDRVILKEWSGIFPEHLRYTLTGEVLDEGALYIIETPDVPVVRFILPACEDRGLGSLSLTVEGRPFLKSTILFSEIGDGGTPNPIFLSTVHGIIGRVWKMSQIAEEWLEQAEYDLETAEHMLSTGRYLYVIFFCHLAIEKALKAAVVEVTGQVPPRTHNLIRLAQAAKVAFPDEHAEFLGMINDASVVTRYPENLRATLSRYTATVAHTYLRKAKEVIAWLKQHPPLNASSIDTGNSSSN